MDIKLKLRIETPYGKATKIKVNSEGEIVFITPVKIGEREIDGEAIKKKIESIL